MNRSLTRLLVCIAILLGARFALALTPPPIVEIPIFVGTSGCPAMPAVVTPVRQDVRVDLTIGFCATVPPTGTLTFTSSDPAATLPPNAPYNSLTMQPQAQSAGSVTFRTPGVQTLTARDTANPAITWTIFVEVMKAAASLTVECAQIAIALPPTITIAGEPHPIIVTNCGTNATGVLSISSTDLFATLPAARTYFAGPNFGEPAGDIVFRTLGPQTITLRDAANTPISTFHFVVVASRAGDATAQVPVNTPLALGLLVALMALIAFVMSRRESSR